MEILWMEEKAKGKAKGRGTRKEMKGEGERKEWESEKGKK